MVTVVVQIPPAIAALLPPGLQIGALFLSNFGQNTLTNDKGSQMLPPGFAAVVGPDGLISTPFRLPDAVLQLITQLINSKPGQNGGVAQIPTNGNVPTDF